MAFLLADRVQETTTTTGTGTITLAGAVTGFQSFAAIGNGNTTFYTIADQTGSNWEVGIGTYTSSGTTLSRDTILASSNSGSAVNFGAGTKNVFVTYPAGRAAYGLTAGSNITLTPGNGTITIAASSSGGGGLTWQSVQTGNFTASAGNAYPVNTASAAITVTLPASPSAGNSITLTDYAGTFATNNMTVSPNGNKINSSIAAANFAINQSSVQLVYVDSTQGWKAYSYSVNGLIQNIPIDYVLIAGGGAGGFDRGGGGGAGGYLSNTSVNLLTATSYTVTVGAGAAARTSQGAPVQGSNSVLASFTATGGGGGQGADQAANSLQNGGSGGGGAGSLKLTGGTAVSGQGNAGGTATYAAPYYGAGGGGGASSVGGNGTSTVAGNGGSGTASSITGSSVNRAGGGGGGTYGGGTAGTASSGGGNGATNGAGTSGTANTGGGGGGGGIGAQGGSGGSGVVIIAYPDTYPALASIGAGLTYDQPTRSGYRVYRFTQGTGTISW